MQYLGFTRSIIIMFRVREYLKELRVGSCLISVGSLFHSLRVDIIMFRYFLLVLAQRIFERVESW